MKIAVVTALWYEDRFLPALFASLEAADYPREDWEIIMIDNRNSPKTREWIEKNVLPKVGSSLPRFELLATDSNLGFAGGNNACIRKAMADGCEAVYLLNEDAAGEPGFLKKAAERLAGNPKIGAVQSFIVMDPAEKGVNSIGNRFHFLGLSWCGGAGMSRHDAAGFLRVRALRDPELKISAASGAAVLYGIDALNSVGLLDEAYHLYHEDLDLSLRLREVGLALVVEPSSVVRHRYEFSRSAEKYYWMERNRYRLVLEHYRFSTLLLLLPAFLAAEIGLLAFNAVDGTLKARLRAYGHVLNPRNWPAIWRKRRAVQEKRVIGDRELLATAVSAITSQETDSPVLRLVNPLLSAYWGVVKAIIYW